MSGSGNSGIGTTREGSGVLGKSGEIAPAGGAGGGGIADDACMNVHFSTMLGSPKDAVVDTLKIHDVLDVVRADMGSCEVVQVRRGEEIAGGIGDAQSQKLLACLKQGYTYQATVTSLKGGQVGLLVAYVP